MASFHLSNFGSFGGSLSRFADVDGYVTYSPRKVAAAHRAREAGRAAPDERHEAIAAAELALGAWRQGERGGAREGAGRPPASSTGERRVKVGWTIAPSAVARVSAEAERRGMSASALVEEWALGFCDLNPAQRS